MFDNTPPEEYWKQHGSKALSEIRAAKYRNENGYIANGSPKDVVLPERSYGRTMLEYQRKLAQEKLNLEGARR